MNHDTEDLKVLEEEQQLEELKELEDIKKVFDRLSRGERFGTHRERIDSLEVDDVNWHLIGVADNEDS